MKKKLRGLVDRLDPARSQRVVKTGRPKGSKDKKPRKRRSPFVPPPRKSDVEDTPFIIEPVEPDDAKSSTDDLSALEAANLPEGEDDDDGRWRQLAERFLPIYLDAAHGKIAMSQSQRMIVEKIMERGFGRVGVKKPRKFERPGVVILPTLGMKAEIHVVASQTDGE